MKKGWLNGKTVIISGASGGLGFNIAKKLIEDFGCEIIAIARNEEKILKAKKSLLENEKHFKYYLFDVSKKENWADLIEKLEKDNIFPDVLINNAGFMLQFSKYEKYTEEEIDENVETNFKAYLYSVKYLLPLLKKSKTPAIINVSSAAGNCPVVGESLYCAVKFAVKGFTETLIQEYKDFYIGGIYPGFIRTNILNRMSLKDKENGLIQKLMMPVEKASRKITKSINKKKKRIIIGIDGKSMSFFYRLFPSLTAKIITKVLKKSKLELFSDVFNSEEGEKTI